VGDNIDFELVIERPSDEVRMGGGGLA